MLVLKIYLRVLGEFSYFLGLKGRLYLGRVNLRLLWLSRFLRKFLMKFKKCLVASIGSSGIWLSMTFDSFSLWKCLGKVFTLLHLACGALSCLNIFPLMCLLSQWNAYFSIKFSCL